MYWPYIVTDDVFTSKSRDSRHKRQKEKTIVSTNLTITGRRREVAERLKGVISADRATGQIVLSAFEARGGNLGRPVLAVLIVSTLATIGIFATLSVSYF
jgi:hypothetical protein